MTTDLDPWRDVPPPAAPPWEQPAAPQPIRTAQHVDVASLLADGLPEPPQPTTLRRQDGHALFYAGKVNVVFGDPECGKTWIALAAYAEALNDNRRASVVDVDHNGATEIVSRLLLLGAQPALLSDPARFRLYEPDDAEELRATVTTLQGWRPATAVVDSLGEIIPMLGLSSNSPDDYSSAHREVLSALATAGAAVIAVDHLPKSDDARVHGQTGTAAKRRAVNGASLRVTLADTFIPGRGGAANLAIHKDRPGGLRAHCPADGKTQPAGRFVLNARPDGTADWWVTTPDNAITPDAGTTHETLLDVAELDSLDPPPTSVRDVQTRMKWGGTRASAALRTWKEQAAA